MRQVASQIQSGWETLETRRLEAEGVPWFHSGIPTALAERLLRTDGDFLVRLKEKPDGTEQIVLSARHADRHLHFRVCRDPAGALHIRSDVGFESVKTLVEHHLKTRLPLGRSTGDHKDVLIVNPVSRNCWELRATDVVRIKTIGKGAFGEVWLARAAKDMGEVGLGTKSVKNGSFVAVKTCRVPSRETRASFRTEAFFQLRFSHPNIVTLLGIVIEDTPLMIVMEYLSKGSLDVHLFKTREKEPDVARLRGYSVDAAKGMSYLESQHVIHRDLAARNCFLSQSGTLKIGDFGLARARDRYKMRSGQVGAIRWLAPEVLTHGRYSSKSDVWSFGVLLWETWSQAVSEPYPHLSNKEVKLSTVRNGCKLAFPHTTPKGVEIIARRCWEPDPERRPTFGRLVGDLGRVELSSSRPNSADRSTDYDYSGQSAAPPSKSSAPKRSLTPITSSKASSLGAT